MTQEYDAILLVSFGGPEGPDDVVPFLENVTRGRGIPRERLAQVGEHYHLFGGVSPINNLCRELIAALESLIAEEGPKLPVYWGNRNWHPMIEDTVAKMQLAKPDLEVVRVPNRGHAPLLNEPAAREAIDRFLVRLG